MPIYFTGQTGPALPLNSIQYNSGPGRFAGDANLTWDNLTGPATKGLKVGTPYASFSADVQSTILDFAPSAFRANDSGVFALGIVNEASDDADFYALAVQASRINAAPSTAATYGSFSTASANGAANSGYFVGIIAGAALNTATTTNAIVGFKLLNAVTGGGTALLSYGSWAPAPFVIGVGSNIVTHIAFYSDALTNIATNPYSFWHDEQGVFRIKSDNTFNSVYQAIPALYNPQFTKYTPGAVNFERIILGQWASNVAQIGTEKGGTGTLRAMDFIGASAGFPLSAANGQNLTVQILTELTTIAAAATTDTAIQIPANAVVFGVDVRVTVAIPTAATFTVIGAGSATVFNTAAVTVAANSTNSGTKSCPFYNATAQSIRITPDVQPAANTGRVRVTIHYYTVTPATS